MSHHVLVTFDLQTLADDFAAGLMVVDTTATHVKYKPGIGPHKEVDVVRSVLDQMKLRHPDKYATSDVEVPYGGSGQACDLVLRDAEHAPTLAVEVKMHRLFGDNGKRDDYAIKDLLSPYSQHHSAVTDCAKLAASNAFSCNTAILIYAFAYPKWPMEPAIEAFEALATLQCLLGRRHVAPIVNLIHPVHREGAVFVWPVEQRR
jgi:hypothetical protein